MLYGGETKFKFKLELKRILGLKIFRTVLCNLRLQVFAGQHLPTKWTGLRPSPIRKSTFKWLMSGNI